MDNKIFITPDYITADDLKRIRKLLNMTQKEFAMLIGCSKPTVERWERSSEQIRGPICLLLKLIEQDVQSVLKLRVPKKDTPIRLWYMYNQMVCTIIDVNELKREVRIYNCTDNVMFRAFGVTEKPDFEMYTEFLESRCFPEGRDKMKLVLKDLNLPFYDPFMIIEKTEGRMAEDDFWIRIER
ncbi:MAG: helix-turn-helix domain-containing protein [Lachnospiraceae bacterium]|nr:helix-turn-helix domain-containing protein [Lachnospiraceae bacterium]